jgi:hypothetical protein
MSNKKSSFVRFMALVATVLLSCCMVIFIGQLAIVTMLFPKSEMLWAANSAAKKGDYFSSWIFANVDSVLLTSLLLTMILLAVFVAFLRRKSWARILLIAGCVALSAASVWAILKSHEIFLRNDALRFQTCFDVFCGFIVVASLVAVKMLVDTRFEFSSMAEKGTKKEPA